MKRAKRLGFNITNEAIMFQNDDFGPQLEAVFTRLRDVIINTQNKRDLNINNLPFKKELELIIFNRLGIKTLINFDYPTLGAVVVFPITKYNILIHKSLHGHEMLDYYNEDISKIEGKKGNIDIRLAKVSGIFSEYKHPMFFDLWDNFKNQDITPAELTAITLHELGHVFTYYEYSDRLESSNQVLSDLARNYVANGNEENRQYIVKELGYSLNLKQETISDLLSTKSRLIFGQKLFIVFFKEVYSQYLDNKYDETSSEQLADNFASRFGYGKFLVSSLSKFYNKNGLDNNAIYSFVFFFNYVLPTLSMIYLIISIPTGNIFSFIGLGIFIYDLYTSGDRYKNMTYDDNKYRFKRIRDQYIAMISKTELSAKEMKDIVSSIKMIDNIIKNTRNNDNLYSYISNAIFKTNRDAKNSIELQQFLEDLAHNDLYLKSAELRTIHS